MSQATGTKQSGGINLFPDTPTIKKEPPKGQVHETTVTGVDSRTFDSGATALVISLKSENTGRMFDHMLFLPTFFVENVKVNPETLSQEKPVKTRENAEGEEEQYEGQSDQQQYAVRIRNEAGTGDLETLFAVAVQQGRADGVDLNFTNFDELVTVLGKVLPGTEFLMTLGADKNPKDPAFADNLRVRRLINPIETSPKLAGTFTKDNPKRFTNLRKMWED